ncbi:MAG: hypothetical protein HRU09_17670 [Oligoflexales bacterium]|nr:hypothetical protein [Oligoflexales bacterium]
MPKSWYDLEESPKQLGSVRWEKPSKDFDKEVDDIFEAQGDSYDALLQESNYGNLKSLNGWELSVIRSQLALTADGVLGVLALKGTVAAELRWFKKSYIKEMEANYDLLSTDAAHATLSMDMSDTEINNILAKIADKAAGTGRIRDRGLMLEGLQDRVNKTKQMLFSVPDTSVFPFSLYRLRLEIIFGASGRALPFMTAGGDVRIRLDWDLVPSRNNIIASKPDSDLLAATNDSFDGLVTAFSQDMGVLVKREPFGSKFRVKGFQIRIAQTAGGRVGVANASGSLGCMLFFKKNRISRAKSMHYFDETEGKAHFNLIRFENQQSAEKEQDSYILSDDYMTKSYQSSSSVTSIDRSKFRKGLEKAENIARYFIGRAKRVKNRNWELREIRTDYQLSLAGSVGMATIGGFGELRIEYAKI